MKYIVGQKIRGTYWIGVYKPNIGGFRSEMVSAELEVISPGRAKVVKAELDPAHSNRQWFNASKPHTMRSEPSRSSANWAM